MLKITDTELILNILNTVLSKAMMCDDVDSVLKIEEVKKRIYYTKYNFSEEIKNLTDINTTLNTKIYE